MNDLKVALEIHFDWLQVQQVGQLEGQQVGHQGGQIVVREGGHLVVGSLAMIYLKKIVHQKKHKILKLKYFKFVFVCGEFLTFDLSKHQILNL